MASVTGACVIGIRADPTLKISGFMNSSEPDVLSHIPVRVVRVAVRIVKVEVGEDELNSLVRLRY